jgi:hypothetical protein
VELRLTATADQLADRLGWLRIDLPNLPIPAALQGLQAGGGAEGGAHDGALAMLPVDPGLWLPGQGTWAEALGAWRQPVLAALPADDLNSGTAAALVALLRQEGVPMVGLLQLGGPWEAAIRREDGLPWLGCWPEAGGAEDEWDLAETALISLRRSLQGLAAGQ